MGLSGISSVIWKINELLRGAYDVSEFQSVSNAAAPGTLIRETTSGHSVNVTDIIVYNPDGAAAKITFYDEGSKVYLRFEVGADETVAIDLKSSLVYGGKSVYARTDQATNADITIAGKETR